MSALDDAASMDPWAHRQLQRMKEEMNRLRAENEILRAALQKVLDDSEIGVVPRAHLNYIEQLLRGEGE